MNIYFAGSIRSGRPMAADYRSIIGMLDEHGRVLTRHVGDEDLLEQEESLSETEIYERDAAWMGQADILVAEVTVPSTGVGLEIGMALSAGLPVIALYHDTSGAALSAMVAGNRKILLIRYLDPADLKLKLEPVMKKSRMDATG
ncbi:nucleoside 2-deoxyribosyltransferase [bacterium]|nr:nucleoside 2-deoxyribosyltransferase [bacterium]